MNYKEPDFTNYQDRSLVSKETITKYDKEKKEKISAEEAEKIAGDTVNKIRKERDTALNFKNNLTERRNGLQKEVNELQTKYNSEKNQNIKNTIEKELNKLKKELNTVSEDLKLWEKNYNNLDKKVSEVIQNYNKLVANRRKEKQDYENIAKTAREEFKVGIEKKNFQDNLKKNRDSIKLLSSKNIDLNLKIGEIQGKIDKIQREKLDPTYKEVTKILNSLQVTYNALGLKFNRKDQITKTDREFVRNLDQKNSNVADFNRYDTRLKSIAKDQGIFNNQIEGLKREMKNMRNEVIVNNKKMTDLGNQNQNILAQAKQKGIDIKA